MTKITSTEHGIKQLKAERDAAQTACAEMRKIFSDLGNRVPVKPRAITWENGVEILDYLQDVFVQEMNHLLPTNHGKGYFHVGELDKTIELLNNAASGVYPIHTLLARALEREARRLTALREGK